LGSCYALNFLMLPLVSMTKIGLGVLPVVEGG
jgi:hypothetical protein